MKVFKHRNMMGIIYSLLLAIPVLSIAVRSAYVVVNKNAYQSYSGNIETSITTQYNLNQLKYNENYSLLLNPQMTYTGDLDLYGDYIKYINYNNIETDLEGYTRIQFFGNNQIAIMGNGLTTKYTSVTNVLRIDFIYFSQNNVNFEGLNNSFIQTKINPTSQLDNVFEYSIDSVIKENNFGKIDFLSWFSDMFLDDNQVNNRYVGYSNWYMNYVLFVSCAFILFLCLMWFVNFSRRVLERGMNYDW